MRLPSVLWVLLGVKVVLFSFRRTSCRWSHNRYSWETSWEREVLALVLRWCWVASFHGPCRWTSFRRVRVLWLTWILRVIFSYVLGLSTVMSMHLLTVDIIIWGGLFSDGVCPQLKLTARGARGGISAEGRELWGCDDWPVTLLLCCDRLSKLCAREKLVLRDGLVNCPLLLPLSLCII